MQGKIDDFFSRVRLVAFDGRSQEQLNKPVSSLESLGSADLSSACDEVKHFPLALVSADARLPPSRWHQPGLAGRHGGLCRPGGGAFTGQRRNSAGL